MADEIQTEDAVLLSDGFESHGTVSLVGATVDELRCTRGTFRSHAVGSPALEAERLCAGDVHFDRTFNAAGEVRIVGSRLRRQLNCTKGTFIILHGYTLDADELQCGGDFFLNEAFSAQGQVRLNEAEIARELNCKGAHFGNVYGTALCADGVEVRGSTFLDRGFQADGGPGSHDRQSDVNWSAPEENSSGTTTWPWISVDWWPMATCY